MKSRQLDSVLITGCSSGFGLETALYLAERGFQVYATVLSLEERSGLLEAAAQRGVTVNVLQMDVTDESSIDRAVRTMVSEAGDIFALVNNAGLGQRGCFEDLSNAEIRQLFDVNFFGALSVTRKVLPHMRAAGRGRIVSITSVGGRIASFGISSYCASKFALEGFGESLALEVAPFGIQSILIEPGIVKTPHWTVNRGTAKKALDPASPYYEMFRRHEAIADQRTRMSRILPIHVAKAVHRALTARRPRMRYVVGLPASLAVALRRYLPEGLFERVYFGFLNRQITQKPTSKWMQAPGALAHPRA